MKIVRAVSEKNGSLINNKEIINEGYLIGPAPTSVGGPIRQANKETSLAPSFLCYVCRNN